MDNKELLDALAQVPELVEAAKTYKVTSERIVSSLADAIKQRPQAVIPEEELKKLSERISSQRCAPPDPELFSVHIARGLEKVISPMIENTARKSLSNASVEVKHTYAYCFEKDLLSLVNARVKKIFLIMVVIIITLTSYLIISSVEHHNSDMYWGKMYNKVYSSKLITDEERERIKQSSFPVAILPHKYYDDMESAKRQIKAELSILKKREKEAKRDMSLWPHHKKA